MKACNCKSPEIGGSNRYDASLVESSPDVKTPQDFIDAVESW